MPSEHPLKDRVVLITGASSGIGEATAIALAQAGASVVAAARRAGRLDALVKQIEHHEGKAIGVTCDVTRRADNEAMVREALDRFGRVDALVANAGLMPLSPIESCDVENWDRMIDVNCKGLLYSCAAVIPRFIEQKGGHIVNVSSVAGRIVFPGGAIYCGTKHFVHAVSEGMRAELHTHNVRVTTIAPGYVATELQSHIADKGIKDALECMYKDVDVLQSENIASAILYALAEPGHVSVNEILVRPTHQPR